MIASRVLSRDEWEPILKRLGCKRLTDVVYARLESAEYWLTAHGKTFPVAVDNAEGKLRVDDLKEALVQIEKLRPLDL